MLEAILLKCRNQINVPTTSHFPQIKISNGALEALKWLAMILMTIDHVNRIFFDGNNITALSIGRVAMPLFAFVFVYNLARPEKFTPAIYFKTFTRLIFFGILAMPSYMGMMKSYNLIPLNILFSFLVASSTLYFYEKEGTSARTIFCFLVGGILVEYNWLGIFICISSWLYCKKPSIATLLICFAAYFLLDFANNSNWTLLAIPIIILATQIDINIPRWRYFFWWYYPLHLTILLLIKMCSRALW